MHRRIRATGRASAIAFAIVVFVAGLQISAGNAAAASCNGASHDGPTLSGGRASPGSGSKTSTITFSVRYVDPTGCSPSSVEVIIAGVGRYRLTATGSSFSTGVTFRVGRRLPVGRWAYRFTAVSGSGAGERTATLAVVSPTRVVIKAPKPAATPRPAAKPKPKPSPTPSPRPKPPDRTPTTSPRAGSPPPSPSASPSPTAPEPTSAPNLAGIGYPGGGPDDRGGRPVPSAGSGSRDPRQPTVDERLGIGIQPTVELAVAAWSIATALGVLVFAIGLLPLRRPHDRGESRIRPALAGGGGMLVGPPSEHRDERHLPDHAGAAAAPRWLQRSAGWMAGPEGAVPADRPPLLFEVPPRPGVERRRIAYRFVRVADRPDDSSSMEVSRLDRGDEVEITGEHEGYLHIVTPDGVDGWVQRVVIVG